MPRPGAAAPGVDALFASLYAELHRLARRQLQGIAPGESLGTTTLLHEAYLKLHDLDAARFPDRCRWTIAERSGNSETCCRPERGKPEKPLHPVGRQSW